MQYASSIFHGQFEKFGKRMIFFFAGQITHCQIEKLQSQREVTMMTQMTQMIQIQG